MAQFRQGAEERFGLWGVLTEVAHAVFDKALSHIAAGVAFFMLFSIFPAIVVAISAVGLFFEPAQAMNLVKLLKPLLPADGYALIELQAMNTIAQGGLTLSVAALISFALAFWSAGAAVRALLTAMNIAFPSTWRFGAVGFYVISIAATVVAIGIVVGALALLILLPAAIEALKLLARDVLPNEVARNAAGVFDEATIALLELPLMISVGVLALTLVYRAGAARGLNAWRASVRGALSATVLWVVSSKLLTVYLTTFADVTKTYGPLGAVAGLMLWFWLTAFLLLLGAEVAAALDGGEKPSEAGV